MDQKFLIFLSLVALMSSLYHFVAFAFEPAPLQDFCVANPNGSGKNVLLKYQISHLKIILNLNLSNIYIYSTNKYIFSKSEWFGVQGSKRRWSR